jgi:hypothetical protein
LLPEQSSATFVATSIKAQQSVAAAYCAGEQRVTMAALLVAEEKGFLGCMISAKAIATEHYVNDHRVCGGFGVAGCCSQRRLLFNCRSTCPALVAALVWSAVPGELCNQREIWNPT